MNSWNEQLIDEVIELRQEVQGLRADINGIITGLCVWAFMGIVVWIVTMDRIHPFWVQLWEGAKSVIGN